MYRLANRMYSCLSNLFQRLKAEKLAKKKKQDEALRIKRSQEEKEKWWQGADLFRIHGDIEECDDSDEKNSVMDRMARYTADYSRWEQWKPADPATIAEVSRSVVVMSALKNCPKLKAVVSM